MKLLNYEAFINEPNEAETPKTPGIRLVPETDIDKSLLVKCLLAEVQDGNFWTFPVWNTHRASIALASLIFDSSGFAQGVMEIAPIDFNPLNFLSDGFRVPATFWLVQDAQGNIVPMWRAEHPSLVAGTQKNALPHGMVFADLDSRQLSQSTMP